MEGGDWMNAYVTLCDQCFSDLYRVAKIAVCHSSVASELVKRYVSPASAHVREWRSCAKSRLH